MTRDFRPIDNGSPSSSSTIRLTDVSQHSRFDVSAVTPGPFSISPQPTSDVSAVTCSITC
jgi:hypothetical protein